MLQSALYHYADLRYSDSTKFPIIFPQNLLFSMLWYVPRIWNSFICTYLPNPVFIRLVLTIGRLNDIKLHGIISESDAACYDRDHPRYPYKSHGQWLKATYGMAACIIILLFNGIFSFLTTPFDYQDFLVAYVEVSSTHLLPQERRMDSKTW